MSNIAIIFTISVVSGLACSLCGVFLVLRRMAMMADAISHAILPGLVAGYVLARGPSLMAGVLGAAAAGLVTVVLVEVLTKSKRVKEDTAIGIVFPALFALGVFVVSKFFANVHIDTDAVLYGEIAFTPFDRLMIAGRDYGPQALWMLGGVGVVNALLLTVLYKELKLSTFDPLLAATLGFFPALLHYLLMTVVALTTVGAFSAVGAILSVALIIVPPVTASLLTHRLPVLIGLSVAIGAACGAAGCWLAFRLDVSISGMIAVILGLAFLLALFFAPQRGLVAQTLRRRRQRQDFAVDMLLVHLATHEGTSSQSSESSLGHLERELLWPWERAVRTVRRAQLKGLLSLDSGPMKLTDKGHEAAARALGIGEGQA